MVLFRRKDYVESLQPRHSKGKDHITNGKIMVHYGGGGGEVE